MAGARRNSLSVGLAVGAGLALLIGAILLYARVEVIDEDAFADNAVEALQDDATRDVIATELVIGLVENGSPNLVAARPLVQSVVDTVIDTAPFRQVFREAARQTNLLLFERDERSVAFDLADASSVVRFALESVDPKLAEELPQSVDLALVKLKEREFAAQTLQVADTVRVLGIVAPVIALHPSGAVDPRRPRSQARRPARRGRGRLRREWPWPWSCCWCGRGSSPGWSARTRSPTSRCRTRSRASSTRSLGGLFRWGLLLALVGGVVAGAAAVLDPERDESPAVRLWNRLSARPAELAGSRALRALAAIAAGFLIAFEPGLALSVAGLLLGAFLIYYGAGELLLMLQPDDRRGRGGGEAASASPRRCGGWGSGGRHRDRRPRRDERRHRIREVDAARGLQRLGGAVRPAPERGGVRGHPQLVLRRRQPGLVPHQPAAHDRAPAPGRDPAVPPRRPLGRRDGRRDREHRLRGRAAGSQQGRQGASA